MQTQLRAHQVHQVGGVLAVEDGERRVHAAAIGVLAQQPRADAVEGAGPRQHRMRDACPALAEAGDDAFHAPRHLHRRAAREGQQQDRARIDTAFDQARDAMRERVGLAGARAGDDQQRAAVGTVRDVEPMARSSALFGVQAREQAVDAGGWAGLVKRRRERRVGRHGGDESMTVNPYSTRITHARSV